MHFVTRNPSLKKPLMRPTSLIFSLKRNVMVRRSSVTVCCLNSRHRHFFSLCDNDIINYTTNRPTRFNFISYNDIRKHKKALSLVEKDKKLVLENSHKHRRSDTDIPKHRKSEFVNIFRNLSSHSRTVVTNVYPVYICAPSSFLLDGQQHAFFLHFRFYTSKVKSSRTSYYDVLGVTPNATQSQIKSAYYRLSKLHHPDTRKEGKEEKSFVNITEAYEVLGNIRKRRLYDRGVYNPRQHDDIKDEDSEPAGPSYNESEGFTKKRRTPPTGHSKIYNFDEFYKQHYGHARMRKKADKKHDERKEREDEEFRQQKLRAGFLTGCLISWIVLTFAYLKSH